MLDFRGGSHPKVCPTSLAAPRFLSSAWSFCHSLRGQGWKVAEITALDKKNRDKAEHTNEQQKTATTMQHGSHEIWVCQNPGWWMSDFMLFFRGIHQKNGEVFFKVNHLYPIRILKDRPIGEGWMNLYVFGIACMAGSSKSRHWIWRVFWRFLG